MWGGEDATQIDQGGVLSADSFSREFRWTRCHLVSTSVAAGGRITNHRPHYFSQPTGV